MAAWLEMAAGFQLGPAPLELAQDSPEEPAVHQPRHAPARARSERERLGVLEMVRDFVKERVEKLFDRATAFDAVVRVNPHQAPRPVVAAEHALGGP